MEKTRFIKNHHAFLQGGNKGSISLETAISLPVILLLLGTFICVILAVETEIKLKGALDRTAAELSLLSPTVELLQQGKPLAEFITDNSWMSTFIPELQSVFPAADFPEIISDASLDLASSAILGRIIHKRINYWLSEAWSGQPGWQNILGSRKLYLDWRLEKQQLWLCMNYQIETPAGQFTRHANAVVPIWTGHSSEDQSADEIWQLDNFSRGLRLRQIFAGNLPYDFPVIARFANGEVTAIKSMDLTAPTYQAADEVIACIRSQIEKLAEFQGCIYDKAGRRIEITASSIISRKLLLIIPGNCPQTWLAETLANLQREASASGIRLEIVKYGNSTRYLQDIQGRKS